MLADLGCESDADLMGIHPEGLIGHANCGAKTTTELATFLNFPRQTALDAIAAALCLSLPSGKALKAANDALLALRRSGFAIVPSKPASKWERDND